MKKLDLAIRFFFLIIIVVMPALSVKAGINYYEPSSKDIKVYNELLEPVFKVLNFVKYAGTIVAVLYLFMTAITFITSGNNIGIREANKSTLTFIIIGLVIIWGAPTIVNFLMA